MNVEVHILSHDGEIMIGWALRHYRTFSDSVIVHDGGPDGFSSSRASLFGAASVPWDTKGCLNDALAMDLKNKCWQGTTADWVICVDADELVYFPGGAEKTLSLYEGLGAAVIKPLGFEMFTDSLPEGTGQIYDYVKEGARDDEWYAKPVLFSPKRVAYAGFGIGAHESVPVLHDGRSLRVDRNWPQANPPTYLLHFHQIGPIEHVAARYDETRKRLSPINEKNGWGNFKSGRDHAQEKRDRILPNLETVVHG